MDLLVVTYSIYLLLSIGLTIWVARTLHHNGRVFLVDIFKGNEKLADSVNHLLVVGFYLVNLGYVSLALKQNDPVATVANVMEVLSTKVGLVLLVLGGMHLLNVFVFNRLRTSPQPKAPVPAATWTPLYPGMAPGQPGPFRPEGPQA